MSFTGVATQYLVRMPWGFDVVVVQQNDGSARARLGETIALSWDPGREFVLDAAQSDLAGMDEVLDRWLRSPVWRGLVSTTPPPSGRTGFPTPCWLPA